MKYVYYVISTEGYELSWSDTKEAALEATDSFIVELSDEEVMPFIKAQSDLSLQKNILHHKWYRARQQQADFEFIKKSLHHTNPSNTHKGMMLIRLGWERIDSDTYSHNQYGLINIHKAYDIEKSRLTSEQELVTIKA